MMGGMTRANNIPFTLAAGARLDIPAGGAEFVYLAEATSGSELRLQADQVDVPLIVGRRVEFGQGDKHGLGVINVGSGSVEGVLFLGSGEVRDSTVVGTVSVTNADKDRTLAGNAFFHGRGNTASATEYMYFYLRNPAGSGVRLIVNRLFLSKDSGANPNAVVFVSDDFAALELEAGFSVVDSASGKNKYVGEADSVGQFVRARSTSLGHTNVSQISSLEVALGSTQEISFTEPVVVPPGCALGANDTVVNRIMRMSVEWFEEAI